jgi:transcriptional regulator with XRE-family HTH domain
MKLTSENIKKIKPLHQATEEEQINLDEYILMAKYLSEIENILIEKSLKKKALANKIGTSPSYLTQVFRGDKPLNFKTLAKIQTVLNIHFEVHIIKNENQNISKTKLNKEEKEWMSFGNKFDEKEWTW